MFDDYLYSTDDPDRAILATEALLRWLSSDARLQAAYRDWGRSVQRSVLARQRLQPEADTRQLLAPVLQHGARFDLSYCAGALIDLRHVHDPVGCRAEIELRYVWLAHMLLTVFQTRLLEEATKESFDLRFWKPTLRLAPRQPNETARAFTRRAAAADAPPPGRRRVKNEGVHIARDVEWLYRAKIKSPRDSISSIAKEYASSASRRSDARSVVQEGIALAERILNSIALTDGTHVFALAPVPPLPE